MSKQKEIPMGHFNEFFYFGYFTVQSPFLKFQVKLKKNADENAYKSLVQKFKRIMVVVICQNCRREIFALDQLTDGKCQFCEMAERKPK